MKKLLMMAAVLVGLTAAAQEKTADQVMKVNTERYDFGKIKQNVPVSTYFEITNTSDKPIVVENAWGSCGCTTPEVPKEPIAPGATAKLKVNYNAAALNHFEKDVFIKLAGVTQPKTLKITGDVLDAAAFEATPAVTKKPATPNKIKAKTPAKKASATAKKVTAAKAR